MPTSEKANAPTKVDTAFCDVGSAMSSCVERGVAVVVAEENAVTMAVTEKVLTVSMAVAMICSSSSTAPSAGSMRNENGSSGPMKRAARTTAMAIRVKRAARTHTCRPSRRKRDANGLRAVVVMPRRYPEPPIALGAWTRAPGTLGRLGASGRVVRAADGPGLENQWAAMSRGFESHTLRNDESGPRQGPLSSF